MDQRDDWTKWVDQAELVRIRRRLHMYPELGWDLPMTAELVKTELSKAGVPFEADKYGKNAIVATVNPDITSFTIGLRADMDALPIQENNLDKPYRSRHDGIMHACGHDSHTAMMIETAKVLYALRDRLNCRVKMIFQPSEEGRPSGARTLCEHGVLEGIDCMVMCHVNCGDETNVISSSPSVTNSSSTAFKIEIGGRSVHVATPHVGVDALSCGVKIYQGIQILVSREVDPFDTCVMSVTKLNAGTSVAANADTCVLEGSIRCIKDETMLWANQRLRKLVEMTAEECGCTWKLSWSGEPLPRAINDPALFEAFAASAKKVVGEDKFKILPPSPGAEDFAYYEQHRPGLLFGLGLRNEEKGACYPAHTKDWDIDEDGLSTGVKVFVQFVLDHMNGISGMKWPDEKKTAAQAETKAALWDVSSGGSVRSRAGE